MSNPVEAWLVDLALAGPDLLARHDHERWLSPAEEARAAAIDDARARSAWRQARIALRMLLGCRLGSEVARRPFARGPRGKPVLPGIDGDFSLAHIDGLALVAIAARGAIGIDLERVRAVTMTEPRRLGLEALAAALAPDAPLPDTGTCPGGALDPLRFCQAWTRIEAVAKATGDGVAGLLGRLDFQRAPPASPAAATALLGRAARMLAEADLIVVDLRFGAGLAGAAAIPRGMTLDLARELPADLLARP